jgi:iron complex transport system substrate-binding protein
MVKRTLVGLVSLACILGCGPRPAPAPRPRIISYSPSVTDILYDLDLGEHVVGVTSWCILPPGQSKPVVGSETAINTEAVLKLRPDLIFIQQDPSRFQPLLRQDPNVRVLSVKTDSIEGILAAVRTIAEAAGVAKRGQALAGRIARRLEDIRRRWSDQPRPRVLFAMGYDHPATCGRGTYLDEIITLAGGRNVAAEKYSGWPTINVDVVLSLAPDVLICQTNPQDAESARNYWTSLKGLPAARSGRVYVSTDRRLTIFGSGIADTADQFARWIHAQPQSRFAETRP